MFASYIISIFFTRNLSLGIEKYIKKPCANSVNFKEAILDFYKTAVEFLENPVEQGANPQSPQVHQQSLLVVPTRSDCSITLEQLQTIITNAKNSLSSFFGKDKRKGRAFEAMLLFITDKRRRNIQLTDKLIKNILIKAINIALVVRGPNAQAQTNSARSILHDINFNQVYKKFLFGALTTEQDITYVELASQFKLEQTKEEIYAYAILLSE